MSRFTHIIFDLDNTLYPRSAGLLQEVNRRISLWLHQEKRLPLEDADALRQTYFRRYGTTLGGLVAEGGSDVDAYLSFAHDIPVERYLQPNPALAAMLSSIPLHRLVFTNAPAEYGWRVLRSLGVATQFELVVGIREVGLHSKPNPLAYERLLALVDAPARSCIMVEDRAINLLPARRLGMATVLVDAAAADGVDFALPDVLAVGPLLAHSLGQEEERGD